MVRTGKSLSLWWAALGCLLAGTLWLAWNRVYQVDEAQTVYMASILARGWQAGLATSGQLHLYPLTLLVRPGLSSAELFLVFRLAFWVLFWVNATLVVLAAGFPLRSREGLKALVLAGSLAPWWAYALECRHDNILLLGVLLMWLLARRSGTRRRAAVFFGLGVLALALQACLFKSIATWAPLSALLLLLEPATWRRRAGLGLCWGLGAAAMALAAHAIRAKSGLLANVHEGAGALGSALAMSRFSPLHTLQLLLHTAPLVALAMAGLLVHGVLVLRRDGPAAFRETRGLPETLLFVVGAAAFLANPTPFPYNLAVLCGLAMVAILALGAPWLAGAAELPALPYLLTAAVVLHVVPLGARFAELAGQTNEGQETLMDLAEAMTGPEDTVFDATGLVPTRRAPSYAWFINMTNLQTFEKESMTSAWADQPPAVILASYRFSYLKPADLEFMRAHYLPMRRDLYALGVALTRGGEHLTWTSLKPGRYAVVSLAPAFSTLQVDGAPLGAGFHLFGKGEHTLAPDGPCLLVWAGPTLQLVPPPRPDLGMESACPVPMGL